METKAELEKRINNLKTVTESYKRDLTDAEQQLEAYNQLAKFIAIWSWIYKISQKNCTFPECGDCTMFREGAGCALRKCNNDCATVESLFLGGNADD